MKCKEKDSQVRSSEYLYIILDGFHKCMVAIHGIFCHSAYDTVCFTHTQEYLSDLEGTEEKQQVVEPQI